MCLDALHDGGFRQLNNGIARNASRAHGVSFRWAAVATGLLTKIRPDFLSTKIDTETMHVQPSKYLQN